MTFQEPPNKRKRPNPSDDDIDQQGHVDGDIDNDGADTSDKDTTGYTDATAQETRERETY